MAFGLRVKDSAGNTMLDLSRRLGRIIGFVDTGSGSSGSVSVPQFAGNTAFWITLPNGSLSDWYSPNVSVVGNTLTWAFGGAAVPNNTRIFYGIY